METENKVNYCYACKNFERYYVKGIKQFNKTKVGWCCHKGEVVNAVDGCGEFAIKTTWKSYRKAVKNCLNDMLTEISEMRKIVEEEFGGESKDELL